jgi:hypothetical protein
MNKGKEEARNADRMFFEGWRPYDYPWNSKISNAWDALNFGSSRVFQYIFLRNPRPDEDIQNMNRCAVILNLVAGFSPPPVLIFEYEWKCLEEVSEKMSTPPMKLRFQNALEKIQRANPHLNVNRALQSPRPAPSFRPRNSSNSDDRSSSSDDRSSSSDDDSY